MPFFRSRRKQQVAPPPLYNLQIQDCIAISRRLSELNSDLKRTRNFAQNADTLYEITTILPDIARCDEKEIILVNFLSEFVLNFNNTDENDGRYWIDGSNEDEAELYDERADIDYYNTLYRQILRDAKGMVRDPLALITAIDNNDGQPVVNMFSDIVHNRGVARTGWLAKEMFITSEDDIPYLPGYQEYTQQQDRDSRVRGVLSRAMKRKGDKTKKKKSNSRSRSSSKGGGGKRNKKKVTKKHGKKRGKK